MFDKSKTRSALLEIMQHPAVKMATTVISNGDTTPRHNEMTQEVMAFLARSMPPRNITPRQKAIWGALAQSHLRIQTLRQGHDGMLPKEIENLHSAMLLAVKTFAEKHNERPFLNSVQGSIETNAQLTAQHIVTSAKADVAGTYASNVFEGFIRATGPSGRLLPKPITDTFTQACAVMRESGLSEADATDLVVKVYHTLGRLPVDMTEFGTAFAVAFTTGEKVEMRRDPQGKPFAIRY
jgi:hypothetical protein